ncbi:MAG TPA: hypothetical protein VFE60_01225 [Roseiarcus sp.]|nr:hypothetical protein [Roseiarcus sp.]
MRAGGPCRAEVSGAVQWPSEWAALTTTSHDFRKVSGCGFYAETGTLDLSKPSLSPNDPRVQTIVLIGKGFVCNQGVHLKPGAQTYQYFCDDSFVVDFFSSSDRQKVFHALEKLQAACGMPTLKK